jgi:hypothetical protein
MKWSNSKSMRFITFFLLTIVLLGSGTAMATLIDLENGVTQDDRGTESIYDDRYWMQDLNRFVGMT